MDPFAVHHAFASLRFALHTLGLAACQRELAAIHYAMNVPAEGDGAGAVAAGAGAVAVDSAPKKRGRPPKPAKPAKEKYKRAVIPDEDRCITILPTGKRCSFAQQDGTELCTRHILMELVKEGSQDTQATEEGVLGLITPHV